VSQSPYAGAYAVTMSLPATVLLFQRGKKEKEKKKES
jgi:hypothetical protein